MPSIPGIYRSEESIRANDKIDQLEKRKKQLKRETKILSTGVEKIDGRDGFLTIEGNAKEAMARDANLESAIKDQLDQIDRVSAMSRTIKQKLQADFQRKDAAPGQTPGANDRKFYKRVQKKDSKGQPMTRGDGSPLMEDILTEPFETLNNRFQSLLEQTEFEITIPPSINISSVAQKFVELFNQLEAAEKNLDLTNPADKALIDNSRKDAYSNSKDNIKRENEEQARGGAENFSILDKALKDYKKNGRTGPTPDNDYRDNR